MFTPRAQSTSAREKRCSARWRRSSSQGSAVAESDGDGKMPGLHSCLAGGRRDTAPTSTPASLRSPTRRSQQ